MSTDNQALDAHFAAEFNPDVSAQKVGEIYADALFGVMDNDLVKAKEVLEEYAEFISDVLDQFPNFERILISPLVGVDEKIACLERAFRTKMSQTLFDFLRIVAKHERLSCMRAIYAEAVQKYDQLAGLIPVTIITATPISQEQIDKIAQGLSAKFAGKLMVSCKVDPSQIGGLVVRVGDTIYDGSVATQLENIRRNIVKNYSPKQ